MDPLVQGLAIGFFGSGLYFAVDKYEPDRNGKPTYGNGPRKSKRVCGRLRHGGMFRSPQDL